MNKVEEIIFVESSKVKEGVTCDVYRYAGDDSKDLGIVKVIKGFQTPKQEVLKGLQTLEIFHSGKGQLSIVKKDGSTHNYSFPGDINEVQVEIGEVMQWTAEEHLVFHEVCFPPYEEGRFKNFE